MSENKKVYILEEFYEEPYVGQHLVSASTNRDVVLDAAKRKFQELRMLTNGARSFGRDIIYRSTLMLVAYDNETGELAIVKDKDNTKMAEVYFVTEGEGGELILSSFRDVNGDCREHMPKRPD